MVMSPRDGERQPASALRPLGRCLLVAACLLGAACSSQRFIDDRSPSWAGDLEAQEEPAFDATEAAATDDMAAGAAESPTQTRRPQGFYKPGTGRLVGSQSAPIADVAVEEGQIKLNFQNADLLQVVKVILGDMLGATYVVDPAVQGEVTMQTSRPLSRTDLVPTLELLLRMNDAAIVMDGAVYRIVPLVKAATGVRAPQLGTRIFRCLAATGCASCRCSTSPPTRWRRSWSPS